MTSIISNPIINNLITFINRFRPAKRFLVPFILIASLFAGVLPSLALSPDFYASSSRLASGNWAKIEVKETGMHLIPVSLLKSLGFQDPEKVNVYGNGGRVLSERLDKNMTDDLPLLPSVVTPEGILFFAHGNVTWTSSAQTPTHKINPYSQSGYYFISDCEATRPEPETLPDVTGRTTITTFMQRLLHEEEITAPSNTGRLIFGEDFRTQNKRTFPFKLPDIAGEATVRVAFGAKVTNGKSTVGLSINKDERKTYTINGVTSSETFLVRQTFTANAPANDNLEVAIDYSNTGVSSFAALDYIEVFYPRQLKLTGNDLHFYVSGSTSFNVKLDGCKEGTQIWDVTDAVKPKKINFSLEGTTASFGSTPGYHEFVAFNTGKPERTVTAAGKVANQDIHAMEAPDILIISPETFLNASRRIADLHLRQDGLSTVVLTPEQIYNEFSSGTPDVTAFRKLLKMWYDRSKTAGTSHTAYCILMSRPTYDNKMVTSAVKRNGYPCIPIWQTENMFSDNTSYSTDDYIGMLDDNATELNMSTADIHVAVGRMPVKTVTEAETAVDKLEKYVTRPYLGAWRNSVMLIADDQDHGDHLNQAESVWANLSRTGKGSDYRYEKLYLDSYRLGYSGTGAVYPEAKSRMMEKINEGVMFINYIGHANPKSWTHENLLTWNDINSMDNRNLPFLYAATCNFLRWDADDVSGGELLWLNPDAGVIGMICPSRTVYISLNGTLNTATSRFLFANDSDGNPLRIGDVMIKGKNSLVSDNNRLRYGFCGDPALMLPIPRLNLSVDRLNGISTGSGTDVPVFGARSKIEAEGRVTDSEGNTLDDFNGMAELSLYDAEKVIETFGNGSDGKVMYYNDRKTRLYSGRVKVVNGRWNTTIFLPSEIENNYTAPLLTAYASSDDGREANGSFNRFYIYGYDSSAAEDNEGPVISEFKFDTPGFTEGASVSPSPVIKASFSDPSGINISDGGIGHQLTLSLDNKTFFNDINLYYTPDVDDFTAGTLNYPLSGIPAGEHTLTLTVWDNANNSSSASLSFKVSANWAPSITSLYADASPAVSSVNFVVATDGTRGETKCIVDVLDLNGKTVWQGPATRISDASCTVRIPWNLCGNGGERVQRGIYLYRATITGEDGYTVTKTRKLAVASE